MDSLFWQLFAGEDEKHQANRRFVLQNKKSSKYFLKLKLHICSYRVFEKEGRRQKLNTMQMFSLDSVSLRKLKCFSCSQSVKKLFKLDNMGDFPFWWLQFRRGLSQNYFMTNIWCNWIFRWSHKTLIIPKFPLIWHIFIFFRGFRSLLSSLRCRTPYWYPQAELEPKLGTIL